MRMPLPKSQKVKKARVPQFKEGVKLISYCPICASSCDPKEAKLLGAKYDSHLMHVQCGNCLNAILALVLVSDVGVSSVGLVTDLGFEEVDRFKEAAAVTVDDVIETHRFLKDDQLLWNALFA
jgi:hypothetical protein